MDQDQKRELRQLKREIKRKGGKIRRRQLKQGLIDNPDEAQDTVVDFGRFASRPMNDIDRPQVQQHDPPAPEQPPESPHPDRDRDGD